MLTNYIILMSSHGHGSSSGSNLGGTRTEPLSGGFLNCRFRAQFLFKIENGTLNFGCDFLV